MVQSAPAKTEEARLEARRRMVAYYTSVTPPGPDEDYDALVKEVVAAESRLPGLRDWDSPTTVVTPPAQDAFPTLPHRTPMLSLANAYSFEELEEWEAGLRRLLPEVELSYVVELKIDGVAVSILYEEGQLAAAVTRGDGTAGEEVTRNAKTIGSLPHRLPEPLSLELRGEVYYGLENFARLNRDQERLGEAPFKNPRNAAAGTLRMLDSTQVRSRSLNFAVHGLASPSPHGTHSGTMAWLKGLGLPIAGGERRFGSLEEVRGFYEESKDRRAKLDFQIDGVVVKVDDLALRERFGATSKSPRWAVAFKFSAARAVTELRDVELGVGRTGTLTPVALLEPVELGGTTVSRATLHNFDQVARLGLMIGDRVVLEKGGDVIPKIVEVESEPGKRRKRKTIKPPTECPSCGTAPVRLEGEVNYHCVNPACPAQRAERILHFVSRRAMDIETLGPALVEQLLAKGRVETYADLYFLKVEQLMELERMAAKSAGNVIQAIETSKTRPLDRFIHALGIRYVGERTAHLLALHFKTLEGLQQASVEDLEAVPEIGAVTAKSLQAFFGDPLQVGLIERCFSAGVEPAPLARAATTTGAVAGKTVVITGTLSVGRDQWRDRLRAAGAKVIGSVSKQTDFVLVGDNPGSKVDTARRHGVWLINEAEMTALLEAK